MKSLTKSQLRELRVFNSHDFAGYGNVFIAYRPWGGYRSMVTPAWMVHRPGFDTDPGGHWADYGSKCFIVYKHSFKEAVLLESKEWVLDRYGITEWARTPFGTWMDATFVKRRMAELVAEYKDLPVVKGAL